VEHRRERGGRGDTASASHRRRGRPRGKRGAGSGGLGRCPRAQRRRGHFGEGSVRQRSRSVDSVREPRGKEGRRSRRRQGTREHALCRRGDVGGCRGVVGRRDGEERRRRSSSSRRGSQVLFSEPAASPVAAQKHAREIPGRSGSKGSSRSPRRCWKGARRLASPGSCQPAESAEASGDEQRRWRRRRQQAQTAPLSPPFASSSSSSDDDDDGKQARHEPRSGLASRAIDGGAELSRCGGSERKRRHDVGASPSAPAPAAPAGAPCSLGCGNARERP